MVPISSRSLLLLIIGANVFAPSLNHSRLDKYQIRVETDGVVEELIGNITGFPAIPTMHQRQLKRVNQGRATETGKLARNQEHKPSAKVSQQDSRLVSPMLGELRDRNNFSHTNTESISLMRSNKHRSAG